MNVCSTRRRTNICALFFSFFSFVCSIYYARKTDSLFAAVTVTVVVSICFVFEACVATVRPFCTFFFFRCFCVAGWLILSSIVFYFCSLSWAQSSAPTFSLFPLWYESLILHEEKKILRSPSPSQSSLSSFFLSLSLVVAVCRSINTNSKSDQYNTKLQRCVIHAKDNLKRQTQMRCEAGAARVYTNPHPLHTHSLALSYTHTLGKSIYKIIIIISIKMNKGQ